MAVGSFVTMIAKIVVCALLAVATADKSMWSDFKMTYNRNYADEGSAYSCFVENLKVIEEMNQADSAQHGVNQFSDMCASEFKNYHNLQVNETREKVYAAAPRVSISGAVDWRSQGAVTPVKNQGQCGSCWSFSTTGNLEGQHFKATGQLVSLSEQHLVSCSKQNSACQGGLMDYAFDFVSQAGGIALESAYPYVSGSGYVPQCNAAKAQATVHFSGGHVDIARNENQMMAWVQANGPLSIAVDATSGWQTYNGGVKTSCGLQQLDHGVLIVGFGTDGVDYWIVKNSWGASWGESGYVRLQRGVNCNGLSNSASTVASANFLANL
jgi:C1A family cysteine protease